jgi:hypothetical protein
VKIQTEDTRQQNAIAHLELAELHVPDQLVNDGLAAQIACGGLRGLWSHPPLLSFDVRKSARFRSGDGSAAVAGVVRVAWMKLI